MLRLRSNICVPESTTNIDGGCYVRRSDSDRRLDMTTRRIFMTLLAGLPLAACQSTQMAAVPPQPTADSDYDRWYIGTVKDEPHEYYLVDRSLMKPELQRQVVAYNGRERPGTIVVDIDERFLYLVQDDGKALRYGVGVGRQGFSWKGVAHVGRKGKWPTWNPTATMVSLKIASAGSRQSGIDNPLGARALYLYQGNRDILFRIHGTNEPWSIGEQVSSGCIRMLNEDIVDLYERVPVGATVLVRRNGRARV
jgi:lipoprotein-anchoring transpeptidase ErfK/SrfK